MSANEYLFFAVLGIVMTWAAWHLLGEFLRDPQRPLDSDKDWNVRR